MLSLVSSTLAHYPLQIPAIYQSQYVDAELVLHALTSLSEPRSDRSRQGEKRFTTPMVSIIETYGLHFEDNKLGEKE